MYLKLLITVFLFYCFVGCIDQKNDTDKVHNKILLQFSKQMEKKDLCVGGLGGGHTLERKINLISVTFDYNKEMDIENARKLIVESTDTLLDLINLDDDNNKYFEKFPATPNIALISILGQISKEPKNTFVETVTLIKGMIYYKTHDNQLEHRPYITIFEEPFDEAKKIVNDQKNCLK